MPTRREMKGYIIPILTPFNRDGSIDEQAMRRNISYLIDEGIHGITLTGSFGEFALLSSRERIRLYEVAVDEAAGRCAIGAGTLHASTDEVIRLSQAAEKIGVDALMITPPYYLVPSPRDIKEHFRLIDKSVSLPIVIYNNPTRTGVSISPSLMLELSNLEHVVSMKQSSTFFFELLEIIRLTQGKRGFHVTNGQEIWALPALLMGAEAVYGVSPLVLGRDCIELYDCAKKGDLERGRAVQYRVNQIRAAVSSCEATPAAVLRELANMRGLAGGYSRAPIAEISDEDKAILEKMSQAVGIKKVQ